MITIVNYGMGNLGSLLNMFKRIGVKARIESDPEAVRDAEKLVLPGVGAFDAAMHRINETPGLRAALDHKALIERVPVIGVCLGMQLLTRSSEEGKLPGLGWIDGEAIRFPRIDGLKVPHMGWNVAHPATPSALTNDIGIEPRYYFVHSYFVKVDNPVHSLMRTQYGVEFDSAIGRDNIYGAQFHPEKSHRFGMKILQNFAEL
ncbi:imidazole glycerol phosphate synthase subunit HisH [Herbaspirillum seropedicae]|uniref:Imidazole glycerol phosphate synthase subunit HisH n=1 Tax=Herbaspirillum seropedicae (strain SmR1) TaxID=757424 RepID=D8IUE0_HERSS|nr:imidazole glycerol phosphate synthase subunit HisH [Herbaspirillum seropedicae]ADJ65672.1 glutamine amidotransferase protein [Herbaspirillum seropedicae SmR1]AKN67487.1 imidazole glycerol phosphate synthase [Herbaspirillum seropedicae]NQE32076.1 imidazole glycerol phosphate synthase [Herbaspirillum seropedicae]UMU23495.1 imidazole glycerol phosphate synthase subunit HisH [Herbaspirillum seropedicae]